MDAKTMSFMGCILFVVGIAILIWGTFFGVDAGVGGTRVTNIGAGFLGSALSISGAVFWAVGSALHAMAKDLRPKTVSRPMTTAGITANPQPTATTTYQGMRPAQGKNPAVGEYIMYKGKQINRQDEYLLQVEYTTYPTMKMAMDAIDRGAHGPLSGPAP